MPDHARRSHKKGRPGRAAGETALAGPTNNRSTRAIQWFKKCTWDKWWMEFNTSRDPGGRLTYPTAWSLARIKGKNKEEKDWIYYCIGPKPIKHPSTLTKGKQKISSTRKLPYLGDWQIERSKAYFYDRESLDKMRKVTAERLDGLEAGRGSATIILDLISKWMKYDDKIDEAFNWSPVANDVSDAQKERMIDRFLKVKNKTRHAIQDLVRNFLECHGINPMGGMNDLGALVMAISTSSAKNALASAATGAMLASSGGQMPIENEETAMQIAHAIRDKASLFKMQLPSVVMNGKGEE